MLTETSPLKDFIDPFLEATGLAEKSRRDYGRYLRSFDRFSGEVSLRSAVTMDRAIQWTAETRRRGPHAARNGARYLMSFAQWLARTRYLYDPGYRSVLERLPVPDVPPSSRKALTPAELDEIWTALAQRPIRDRYRAIAFLRLLWATGLRRGQALALMRTDLHLDKSGGGWVPAPAIASKRPRAKQPPRYLDSETVAALQKYIKEQRPTYVGRVREPLFITEDGTPLKLESLGSWLAGVAGDIERLTPSGIKWSSDLMSHTWKMEAAQPIRDQDLRRRCEKFLRAIGDHDQAIREACIVLEDRVRRVSGGTTAQLSSNLMEWAFGGVSPRLRLSDHPNEQRGVMEMYRGITAFYRGGTAHAVRDDFDPNEALRIVSWVDHLLGLLADAEVSLRPDAAAAIS